MSKHLDPSEGRQLTTMALSFIRRILSFEKELLNRLASVTDPLPLGRESFRKFRVDGWRAFEQIRGGSTGPYLQLSETTFTITTETTCP